MRVCASVCLCVYACVFVCTACVPVQSIGSVDTRRRRLRKSKSLALRFNKDKLMSGDWFETSRSKLIRSHSAEQPTGPPSIKFNVAKLDGFILKHTLRPLVAQLGRVDMMAPVNEVCW